MASPSSDHAAADHLVPMVVSGKISDVVNRTRGMRLIGGAVVALAAALAVMLIAIGVDWAAVLFEPAQRTVLTLATFAMMGVLALSCLGIAATRRMSNLDAARQIDEQVPQLEERWTSVTEFSTTHAAPSIRGSETFIRKVAEEAAQLESVVEPTQIQRGQGLTLAFGVLGAVTAVWAAVLLIDPGQATVLVQRLFCPQSDISLTQVHAESGDIIQPRGSNVKLEAVVAGRAQSKAEVTIRQAGAGDEIVSLEPLNADRTRFVYPRKDLQQSFAYRFRSGDGQSAWHEVRMADRPALKLVDFRIIPPAYSKLLDFHQDGLPKSVKALQGSRLLLQFESSIPLMSFVLQRENGIEQMLVESEAKKYHGEIELTESFAFRPNMTSVEGLANSQPPRCEIIVFRDQAPTVDVATPSNEVAVRPDDSITIAFDAKDDLGIARAELVIFESSNEGIEVRKTIPISLGEQVGERSVHAQAELDLAEFHLKHGEQLTYAIRVYDTKDTATTHQPGGTPQSELTQQDTRPQPATGDAPEGRPAPKADLSMALIGAKAPPVNQESKRAAEQSKPDQPPSRPTDDTPRADEPQGKQETTDSEPPREQAGGGNTWIPKSNAKQSRDNQPKGEVGGKPRPEFEMAKHELDTAGGQCTSCSRRRITIDEWAGSFASQVLDKLQLEIDPVLKALKKTLTDARHTLQPLADQAKTAKQWQPADSNLVRQGDGFLDVSEQQVKDLTKKTDGTPYAFIGLQLQDIVHLHIHPAREKLSDVTLFDSSSKPDDLTSSVVHIQRAIELIEKLTWEYEAVKLNQKLAETMTHIKKMNQIFLEGTFALLNSQKPNLNPKDREFMEFDLTEEFLAKLQALLKKKLEIQAELAKVLSQDPRLLERYMARTRLEATTLRDQLTLLNGRQQTLTNDVKDGLPAANDPKGKLTLKNRMLRRAESAAQIAEDTSQMFESYVVWTPRSMDVNKGSLATFKANGLKLVATAAELAKRARTKDVAQAIDVGENLYEQLLKWKESLPDLVDETDDPKLHVHVANRLQDTEKLITQTSGWVVKEKAMEGGDHHLAAEIDQHRITVDTVILAGKLTSLNAQCQGISVKLGEAASTFLHTMNDDLVAELEISQEKLDDNELQKAVHHQSLALTHFASAEKQLDDLMDGIIKHLDSIPFNDRPEMPDDVEPESLESLLAMLDDEARAAESLGIPPRPSNLIIEKDWFKPGQGPGSGGQGGSGRRSRQPNAQMAQARQSSQDAEKLRKQFEDSLKKMMKAKNAEDKGGMAGKAERKWDTLGSKLEEHVRQGRANLPPEQYRKAIEMYFESLAGKQIGRQLRQSAEN
ncbi:hypothetical protein [Schlesneria paludicola]|uniref:hypothetical protein n=1 Tax=Schlesneria paludicola TaxID=360056 RepID=UPI00029B0682|nr:hypothetical protein [Schlesneria paludicola]